MKISDTAVVLRHLDYSETSQVIVFFSREHGKIRAIGKGLKRSTKKRFAVGIDLFEIGRLVLSSRQIRSQSLATIVEWKQTQWLSGLRERLTRIHAAEYAAEITTQLVEDWDPHVDLFDALIATLGELAGASESLPAVVSYQTQLLDGIGALPRFDACVLCGRPGDLTHFSSFEGGTICRHCEPVQVEKRQLSPGTLAVLRGDPGAAGS